jgi:hypothetical protein
LQLLLIVAICRAAWRFRDSRIALAIPLCILISALAVWYIAPLSHCYPNNLSIKLTLFVSLLWLQLAAGLMIAPGNGPETATGIRTLSQAIALGFAAYSAANILTQIVHMHFAFTRNPALYTCLSYFRIVIYLCCLAVWSILLYRRPPSPRQRTVDSL